MDSWHAYRAILKRPTRAHDGICEVNQKVQYNNFNKSEIESEFVLSSVVQQFI